MLNDTLKDYKVILGSGSPRRLEFFKALGFPFEVRLKSVDEVFPNGLKGAEISDYLAKLKAEALKETLATNEILMTSDTIVWYREQCLGKPKNRREAIEMLQNLSADTHEVISSVCFTTPTKQICRNHTTQVVFKPLTNDEIEYYVENFNPMDKAGAYGIQEWIGLIGVEELRGSYYNVMGLPTHLVYKTLIDMVG